jgi:hypothetical protein
MPLLLGGYSPSSEQPDNDTQGDQTDESVFAEGTEERGKIRNNLSEKWHLRTTKDLDDNPKGNQQ